MHTHDRPRPVRVVLSAALAVGSTLWASMGAARAEAPPAPLKVEAAELAKMNVCTDGKSHYVAIGPHERVSHQLYYGDGKLMIAVGVDPSGMVPGNDFLDPRFPNPTANPSFRGIDWRNYSSLEFDAEKKTCALRCGERTQKLSIMPAVEAQKVLGDAKFQASPRTREPHALARDSRGVYYYVDRGNTRETAQNFRVYVGKKGAMKLQKMKDVASDSEGEVFSTATGDLRFISNRDDYTWVQGKTTQKLTRLPPGENLTLIYTTLGIYTGQRLGTPCDDM